ncbi:hypothetical protein ACLB2K_006749 [Fragaria x ananassa]
MLWYEEYLKAQSVSSSITAPTRQKLGKQWQPPSGSIVKLNVNGSFLPDVTQGGFGGVLRDSQSRFLAGFVHRMEHVSLSLHYELEAIRYGVDFLQAMHIADAVVESDCLVAVTTLNSPEDDLSPLNVLILEIKETLAANRGFSLHFAPTQTNSIAHKLANYGFESNIHLEWISHAPDFILDALMYD